MWAREKVLLVSASLCLRIVGGGWVRDEPYLTAGKITSSPRSCSAFCNSVTCFIKVSCVPSQKVYLMSFIYSSDYFPLKGQNWIVWQDFLGWKGRGGGCLGCLFIHLFVPTIVLYLLYHQWPYPRSSSLEAESEKFRYMWFTEGRLSRQRVGYGREIYKLSRYVVPAETSFSQIPREVLEHEALERHAASILPRRELMLGHKKS